MAFPKVSISQVKAAPNCSSSKPWLCREPLCSHQGSDQGSPDPLVEVPTGEPIMVLGVVPHCGGLGTHWTGGAGVGDRGARLLGGSARPIARRLLAWLVGRAWAM